MGVTKVAGSAVKAVPAARVAGAAAGVAKRHGGADPRVSAPGSKAAQQRQAIENIKATGERRRQNAVAWAQMQDEQSAANSDPAEESAPAAPPAPAAGGGGVSLPGMPAAASTGSGFLLGVFAWAFGLAYLRGGMPEVRKLARAKFFNQTGG